MKKTFFLIISVMLVINVLVIAKAFTADTNDITFSLPEQRENSDKWPIVAELSNKFVKPGEYVYIPVVLFTVDSTVDITNVNIIIPGGQEIGKIDEITMKGLYAVTFKCKIPDAKVRLCRITATGNGSNIVNIPFKIISTKSYDTISPNIPPIPVPMEAMKGSEFKLNIAGYRATVPPAEVTPPSPALPSNHIYGGFTQGGLTDLKFIEKTFYHAADGFTVQLAVADDSFTPKPISDEPNVYYASIFTRDDQSAETARQIPIRVRAAGTGNATDLYKAHPYFSSDLKTLFVNSGKSVELPVQVESIDKNASLEIVAIAGLPGATIINKQPGNGLAKATIKWTAPADIGKKILTCNVVARSSSQEVNKTYVYLSVATITVLTDLGYANESPIFADDQESGDYHLGLIQYGGDNPPPVPVPTPILESSFDIVKGLKLIIKATGNRTIAPTTLEEPTLRAEPLPGEIRGGGISSLKHLKFDTKERYVTALTLAFALSTAPKETAPWPTPAPENVADAPGSYFLLSLFGLDNKGALTITQRAMKVVAQ